MSFQATGKVWFTEDEAIIEKFRDLVFPGGQLNKNVVGRSCREIGAMIGVDVPASARIILLPAKGAGTDDILAKEKLCPVVAILPYQDFQEAVAKAKANLLVEGAGHSAALHSNDEGHIRNAGLELPISRLVVNQPSSTSAGGSLTARNSSSCKAASAKSRSFSFNDSDIAKNPGSLATNTLEPA